VSVGCIAAVTAVALLLKALAPDNAFGVLYLIVLIVATGWSLGLAAATAVVSAIAYNYLRRWPDVSGALNQIEDWVVILVFVVVGLVAHVLARSARTRAADAEERRQEAEASRESLGILAEQQAALRRVATLVARGVPASEVFPAVTQELARSLGVANASLWRYEPDGTATLVAACDDPGPTGQMPVGSRWNLEGENVVAMVADSGQPARMDSHDTAAGEAAALIRRLGLRAGVGAPIVVEGRLWGVTVVGSSAEPLPPDAEQRVGEFTELVATAIANAEAHAALTTSRARIVTAADDARRRRARSARRRITATGVACGPIALLRSWGTGRTLFHQSTTLRCGGRPERGVGWSPRARTGHSSSDRVPRWTRSGARDARPPLHHSGRTSPGARWANTGVS
jgi:hypothetical protein